MSELPHKKQDKGKPHDDSTVRKLAAVMFADIQGYTALMQGDETVARRVLRKFREEVSEKVTHFRGQVINFYGDGCLCIFDSAVDAASCAVSMQKRFQTGEPRVPVRIGLHSGDVYFEAGNVYGDSVNLTSRIESMSVPGSVLLSERIYRDLENQPVFDLLSLGKFKFKNVQRPLQVYAIKASGLVLPQAGEIRGKLAHNSSGLSGGVKFWGVLIAALVILGTLAGFWFSRSSPANAFKPGEKSIAVLPFKDLSPNGDQAYFSEGVAEEILTALSRLEDLQVAGRISSFSFKDQENITVEEIGKKLNVSTILNGSIRMQDNKVRITADLVDVKNGYQIWSERYDMELADIFTIQETIAEKIVEKFRIGRTRAGGKPLYEKPTANLEAYEHYLRGRFYLSKSLDGASPARTAFEKSIQLDSNYVQAYVGLANAYWDLGFYELEPRESSFEKGRDAALKALQLDSLNHGAFQMLAAINLTFDWDWESALINMNRSDVGSPATQNFLLDLDFLFNPTLKNLKKLVKYQEELVKKDPLSIPALLMLNRAYLWNRRYDDVIENSRKIFELEPDQRSALRHIGEAYMFSGRPEEALPYFERAITKDNYTFYNYITCLVFLGKKEQAAKRLEEKMEELSDHAKALAFIPLGRLEEAFEYLEGAYQEKSSLLVFYKVEQHYDPIRSDPRYLAFDKKMNFPKELKD